MVKIISLEEINQVKEQGYTVYVITRSIKQIKNLFDNKTIIWFPQVAPPPNLLLDVQDWKKEGKWNKKTFDEVYVPFYLKYVSIIPAMKQGLNELYQQSKKQNIALACYCPDETMCHRSIVCGLLQGAGTKTDAKDYSIYWNMYKSKKWG